MGEKQVVISFNDLGMIISSFYFGGDEDFSSTEDLIDFLTSEENSGQFISLASSN